MTQSYLTSDLLAKISAMPREKREALLKKVGEKEWQLCANDIFYWLDPTAHPIPYVYTTDPHPMHECLHCNDGDAYTTFQRKYHLLFRHKISANSDLELKPHFRQLSTIRELPMLPYFKPIVEAWLNEPLFAIEKSRDMMATWLIVACYTWDTLFHEGRQNIFQSEDASKSLDLVKRANTIYNNQPKWLKNVHKAEFALGGNKAGVINIPSIQSEIIGFPQGASKIRQYHPTGVFSDEAAFNPEAGETFAAIRPAVQNGGRYTAISSVNLGWFWMLCRDTFDTVTE